MGITRSAAGKGDRGKATILHSKIVRARGACERCGGNEYLQTAHIIRRGYSWTRTREDNAWCLCARCHFAVDTTPHLFMELVERTIGRDKHDELYQIAQQGVRVKFDWVSERERLTEAWKQIEA
jgi:hypothetical protein